MGTLNQDFRYGLRMLRKSPGFTAAAVITLALAIGANTAIFSVVYPVLLRPLPFDHPDRLVTIGENRHATGCCSYVASYPDFLDWKRSARSFQSLTGYAFDAFTLTGNGEPKTMFCAMVAPNFFSSLGVNPILGRNFIAGEDLPEGSGPTVAILSYAFWRSDFAGDRGIVGRTIRLDNKPVTVVGVLPRQFEFSPAGDVPLWVPLHLNPYEATVRTARWFDVIGRLAPGVTLQQTQAEMQTISAQLSREYPQANATVRVNVAPLREEIVGNVRPLLLVLFGAVGFVLLIACANVANLLLSRSIDRRREFAIRSALGASRFHLALQLLVESLLLSITGAVLGFLAAALGVWLLVGSIPEPQLLSMPYLKDAGISLPVLAFIAGVTVLTAILFGLGPGLSVSQIPITEVLKDESRGGTSHSHVRMRNLLVIGEIAISLVLLVSGGLMLRSLSALLRQNPGFDPEHVLTFMTNLPGDSYPIARVWPFSDPNGLRFAREFLDRLRALPGVQGASATSALPAASNRGTTRFVIEGRVVAPGQEESSVARRVDADYFAVMKIPLLRGRSLAASDTEDHPWVVVVNQAWAKRFFSDSEDPVGRRLRLTRSPEEPFRQIVGVVGDVAEDTLAVPPPPVMYFPIAQDSGSTLYLNYVVRTRGEPAGVANAARLVLHSIDPRLAFIQPQSMQQFVERSPAVFLRRYPFYLIGSFAVLALVLATIGLYGLISYSVVQRTREIGIRMALGAQREHILRLMIRQGIVAAVAGVVMGLIAGLALTRLMASLLYGVTTSDWLTFTAVSLLLLLVAAAACYIPAKRAARVDPMVALRAE
ncbi:MAG TPA: ABC transporter permease [Candidatus Binatia bacterium]|nr:ABC transporter permease [Candidatus Binatia bacterium]